MLAQLASAATSGFGASLGRDLYRGVKKNPVIAFIIGVLLLAFGWRNLFLGQGRSLIYLVFVTGIGSALMIAAGASLTGLGGYYVGALIFQQNTTGQALVAVGALAIVSLVGILWGRRDRRARQRQAEIASLNLAFMEDIGLRDSGFDSDMLEDADGNRLKLIEQTDDRLVFSVAGRRGLRAAIQLAGGEMVSYSGIVRI